MHLSRRKILILAVMAMVMLGVVTVVFFKGKGEAQVYKDALRAKGEMVYWQDWTAQSTNGNPGYTRVLNAVSGLHVSALPPGNLTLMEYMGPGQARVAWQEAELHGYKAGTNDWPGFLAQMETNAAGLLELEAALTEPEADWGWATTNTSLGPRVNWMSFRLGAQWLSGAVISDLRLGHNAEAAAHLHGLAQLARVHRNNPSLVSQMIRVAIAGLGLSTTWEALQAPGWSEAQLSQLQSDWEQIDLLTAVEKGLVGARIEGARNFGRLRTSSGTNFFGLYGSPHKITTGEQLSFFLMQITADEDELFYLKTMQQQIEHMRLLTNGTPWVKVSPLLSNDYAELNRSFDFPQKFHHMLSAISLPNFTRAVQTANKNETLRRLAVTAIALKRYELRHGKPATSLEVLVPEFLAAMPIDCMDGKALKYRHNADGTFSLYSAGEDGADDGGDSAPQDVHVKKYDLWSGRDAVWPFAATNGSIGASP